MFLKKEVTRYNMAIETIHGIKDKVLDDATKIGEGQPNQALKPEDLFILKQDLKALEKID